MTGSFILTPSAARDIDGIFEYVLEHSGPNRALHLHRRLYEGFSKVGRNPGLGIFATIWLTNRFASIAFFHSLSFIGRKRSRPRSFA